MPEDGFEDIILKGYASGPPTPEKHSHGGLTRPCADCRADILFRRRRCVVCVTRRLTEAGLPTLRRIINEYPALRGVTPRPHLLYFGGGDHAVAFILGEPNF
jgi:hypothetical protein